LTILRPFFLFRPRKIPSRRYPLVCRAPCLRNFPPPYPSICSGSSLKIPESEAPPAIFFDGGHRASFFFVYQDPLCFRFQHFPPFLRENQAADEMGRCLPVSNLDPEYLLFRSSCPPLRPHLSLTLFVEKIELLLPRRFL